LARGRFDSVHTLAPRCREREPSTSSGKGRTQTAGLGGMRTVDSEPLSLSVANCETEVELPPTTDIEIRPV
jgi:hypothetical protein